EIVSAASASSRANARSASRVKSGTSQGYRPFDKLRERTVRSLSLSKGLAERRQQALERVQPQLARLAQLARGHSLVQLAVGRIRQVGATARAVFGDRSEVGERLEDVARIDM